MKTWTRYSTVTGAILGQHVTFDPIPLAEGEALVQGAIDPFAYWIDKDEQPQPLQVMGLVVAGRTIAGLPKGAVIQFRNERIAVKGRTWSAPGTGADLVIVECPRYRTETLTLTGYAAARADAYPPIGDQLDALWKALAALEQPLPGEAQDILARIAAVKAAHPKT